MLTALYLGYWGHDDGLVAGKRPGQGPIVHFRRQNLPAKPCAAGGDFARNGLVPGLARSSCCIKSLKFSCLQRHNAPEQTDLPVRRGFCGLDAGPAIRRGWFFIEVGLCPGVTDRTTLMTDMEGPLRNINESLNIDDGLLLARQGSSSGARRIVPRSWLPQPARHLTTDVVGWRRSVARQGKVKACANCRRAIRAFCP